MIKVIEKTKDTLRIEIDNLTLAELLRAELWNDEDVKVSAWTREHPTKNPVLVVQVKSGSPKKALTDAISRIEKINDKISEEFKKAVK